MKLTRRQLQKYIKESIFKKGNVKLGSISPNYNFEAEEYKKLATAAFNHYQSKNLMPVILEVSKKLSINEDILLAILIDEYVRMYPRALSDVLIYFNLDQSVGISQVKPGTVRSLTRYLPPEYRALDIENMSNRELGLLIQNDDKLAIYFAGAVIRNTFNNWDSAFEWIENNPNAIKKEDQALVDKNAIVGTLYSLGIEPRIPKDGESFRYPKSSIRGMNIKGTADRYARYKKSELPSSDRVFEMKLTRTQLQNLLIEQVLFSEGLRYHVENSIPLYDCIYRPGSKGFFNLISESRKMYNNGYMKVDEDELDMLNSDLGEFVLYEGREVALDFPISEEADYDLQSLDEKKRRKKKKSKAKKSGSYYKGRKVKLNKPKRNSGSGGKFVVYVRNKKTGNIKRITFGARGMTTGLRNPARRKSFAARHRCEQKKDKLAPGYWACRIGRYPAVSGAPYTTWW